MTENRRGLYGGYRDSREEQFEYKMSRQAEKAKVEDRCGNVVDEFHLCNKRKGHAGDCEEL